jgi:hypothetical protein
MVFGGELAVQGAPSKARSCKSTALHHLNLINDTYPTRPCVIGIDNEAMPPLHPSLLQCAVVATALKVLLYPA